MPVNLIPGQYQYRDLVFGKGTPYKVTGFDIQPYGVKAGDYQVPLKDGTQFGFDQITAGPINITLEILQNRWIMQAPPGVDLIQGSLSKVAELWRADDIRYRWGAMEPLYYCGRDGIIKEIYGRPGKFTYPRGYINVPSYEVIGEFRRADTFCYRSTENIQSLDGAGTTVRVTAGGDAPTHVRLLLEGPLTNPVITVGSNTFTINISLELGEFAEISSYPWRQRAVDSNGVNIRAYMSGVDYLDKMVISNQYPTALRWTSDEVNTWVPELGNRDWSVDINDLNFRILPDTFTTLYGKPVIRFDLFNPDWAEKYLASGLFGSTSACVYNRETFNSAYQYSEARIVEPFWGRSGIVIMSTPTMSSGVMLEVVSGFNNNWLRIRNITSPTTYSSVRAQWQNTAFWGWSETDEVAIRFDPDINTYEALFNGDVVCSWIDSGHVVPTSTANRSQGYIFDLDGDLLTVGTGFRQLISYDYHFIPAAVGSIYVLWKDAYQVIE
jgi:hypothetical protein